MLKETPARRRLRLLDGSLGVSHPYRKHLRLKSLGLPIQCWCLDRELVIDSRDEAQSAEGEREPAEVC